jgi:hypothetical protein
VKTLKSPIPLCRSQLLQDVSIALGRRLKALRHRTWELDFEVAKDKETAEERFSVIERRGREYLRVVIWEDKLALYLHGPPREKHQRARYTRYYANLKDYDPTEIAVLIRDTLYRDEEALAFWKRHDAEFQKLPTH